MSLRFTYGKHDLEKLHGQCGNTSLDETDISHHYNQCKQHLQWHVYDMVMLVMVMRVFIKWSMVIIFHWDTNTNSFQKRQCPHKARTTILKLLIRGCVLLFAVK